MKIAKSHDNLPIIIYAHVTITHEWFLFKLFHHSQTWWDVDMRAWWSAVWRQNRMRIEPSNSIEHWIYVNKPRVTLPNRKQCSSLESHKFYKSNQIRYLCVGIVRAKLEIFSWEFSTQKKMSHRINVCQCHICIVCKYNRCFRCGRLIQWVKTLKTVIHILFVSCFDVDVGVDVSVCVRCACVCLCVLRAITSVHECDKAHGLPCFKTD